MALSPVAGKLYLSLLLVSSGKVDFGRDAATLTLVRRALGLNLRELREVGSGPLQVEVARAGSKEETGKVLRNTGHDGKRLESSRGDRRRKRTARERRKAA